MESRLAATATKFRQLLLNPSPKPGFPAACTSSRSDSRSTCPTADPNVHAEEPEDTYDISYSEKPQASAVRSEQPSTKGDDPYVPPKNPPYQSSPKIQRPPVTPPPDPFTRQNRRSSTTSPMEEVSCVGLDGSPWPDDLKGSRGSGREEAEEDNKEYFEHHKATPLSELEFVDTRNPITRATDGTANSYYGDYGGGVVLWRPEQIDTAEHSLRRAMEIWKWNAMRGDPDSPHGRVLRTMRGEFW